jgi:chemotaxis protein CheY-P-specific phosphatase CheC
MNQLSNQQLSDIAARTFENLAFLFTLAEGESAPADPAIPAAAGVRFEGPLSGRLVVTVDQAMLPVLAANMLGLEPGQAPTVGDQCDALKELANVLCGNILPELAGTEAVFTVRPPVLVDSGAACAAANGAAAAGDSEAPAAAASLALDAGTARLALYLFKEAAAQAPSPAGHSTGSH